GERRTPLDSRRGRYTLSGVRRGRYVFLDARAVLEDAFGLQRAEIPLAAPWTLLVYPRLVELERLFSEGGTYAQDGRRLLLRRPSGFDLHSVRDYERGESLRKVHWRSTAKRGELMVKELEDAPRDEIAILLDAEAGAVVGESFDVQVRAAGSLLLAQARRGRQAVLLVNGARRTEQRVHSYETDWQQAYDLLAAAEPDGHAPAAALALAPALLPRPRQRVLALVPASVLALHVALGVWLVHPLRLLGRFGGGFLEFYDVRLPFATPLHPRMEGVILVALFAFCACLGVVVAARRPALAALVLVVGVGWPATPLTGPDDLLRGAVLLAAALSLIAGLGGPLQPRRLLLAGVA